MVKEMTEGTKTQGIKTEATTKEIPNTTKTTNKTELLDLRAGYDQHSSSLHKQRYFCDVIHWRRRDKERLKFNSLPLSLSYGSSFVF